MKLPVLCSFQCEMFNVQMTCFVSAVFHAANPNSKVDLTALSVGKSDLWTEPDLPDVGLSRRVTCLFHSLEFDTLFNLAAEIEYNLYVA